MVKATARCSAWYRDGVLGGGRVGGYRGRHGTKHCVTVTDTTCGSVHAPPSFQPPALPNLLLWPSPVRLYLTLLLLFPVGGRNYSPTAPK